MKYFFALLLSFLSLIVFGQEKTVNQIDSTKKLITVEASCGQCKFSLKGKGCSLAFRIDGKAYFVDGTAIDSHGDAHADDGFCNAIRKAKVQGEIIDNRFKASYFQLLPERAKREGVN